MKKKYHNYRLHTKKTQYIAMQSWLLPILIGLIAAILLVSILFNDKQRFADLGALIQLQTSRPYYYGLNWVPVKIGRAHV